MAIADDHAYAALVIKFAPQIMHPVSEPHLPASVDWILARTVFSVNDAGCKPEQVNVGLATIISLQTATYTSPCDGQIIMASGTRSRSKSRTFLLADLSDTDKRGSPNTTDWTTYYHAFQNKFGGWSVQYWLLYGFKTGEIVFGEKFGYYGGDWEMFQIDLDASNTPRSVAMTGPTAIDSAPWTSVHLIGTHPVVYAASGGHAMQLTSGGDELQIEHPTWPGSVVFWPGFRPSPPGPLVDLGVRLHPLAGFLSYSGLWGSVRPIWYSSGYWGPAFKTDPELAPSDFLTAWCFNVGNAAVAEGGRRECYADDISP